MADPKTGVSRGLRGTQEWSRLAKRRHPEMGKARGHSARRQCKGSATDHQEDKARGSCRRDDEHEGGVGKSTLTTNLGWYAAHERDCRVLLVDLDPQFNLSQYVLGTAGCELLLKEKRLTVESLFRATTADGRPPNLKK